MSKIPIEESEEVVQIDEHRLDKECVKLPTDYLRWAHRAAEAKRDVAELRAALDVARAEEDKAIRDNPGKFGLEKITEAAIKGILETNKRCKAGEKALREAEHTLELSQAVVWAMEHKKRALTLLVELHGMSYFVKDKISDKGREAAKDRMYRGRSREES